MPAMFTRWLRRRLAFRVPDVESTQDDEDRERGTLVRKGRLVTLRTHVAANRDAFQRWYADEEIAGLLRHDLEPLSWAQSKVYFDTFILPASARGICFAIHERKTKRLIGTTALTDRLRGRDGDSALFRIVIGEKDLWGNGYGTEATRLVAEEAFSTMGLGEVRLEVFRHNERAIGAYRRVGFEVSGEHVEWVSRRRTELHVVEMRLTREAFSAREAEAPAHTAPPDADDRARRQQRREERAATRAARREARAGQRKRARGAAPTREPSPAEPLPD
jgi:RimJ/RimL family protein N-acetyltransferase